MTLTEINSIVNKKNINEQKVGRLLTIFREEGNTFINPYLSINSQTIDLKSDSILDITHESLIRNWTRLREWTNEENEHLGTYQDFSKQMQLWLKNNKSKEYLLKSKR